MARLREYRCRNCSAVFANARNSDCDHCDSEDTLELVGTVDSPDNPKPARRAIDFFDIPALLQSGRWLLGGIFVLALSGMLIFMPEFRDDPNRIGFWDVMRGLAAGLAGIGMIGIAVYAYRKYRAFRDEADW